MIRNNKFDKHLGFGGNKLNSGINAELNFSFLKFNSALIPQFSLLPGSDYQKKGRWGTLQKEGRYLTNFCPKIWVTVCKFMQICRYFMS